MEVDAQFLERAQLVDGGLTAGVPWRKQPFFVTQHRPMDGR